MTTSARMKYGHGDGLYPVGAEVTVLRCLGFSHGESLFEAQVVAVPSLVVAIPASGLVF